MWTIKRYASHARIIICTYCRRTEKLQRRLGEIVFFFDTITAAACVCKYNEGGKCAHKYYKCESFFVRFFRREVSELIYVPLRYLRVATHTRATADQGKHVSTLVLLLSRRRGKVHGGSGEAFLSRSCMRTYVRVARELTAAVRNTVIHFLVLFFFFSFRPRHAACTRSCGGARSSTPSSHANDYV